jgi:hypothetical protein
VEPPIKSVPELNRLTLNRPYDAAATALPTQRRHGSFSGEDDFKLSG